MPSTRSHQIQSAPHVAIIMDGNGRWAARRGLPREAGHHAGVSALREIVEAAPRLGIGTLTVYAFSADNWRRPKAEVVALMTILRAYLQNELARLIKVGVRLTVIGRRDRLPDGIVGLIEHAEAVTAAGTRLHLRIAIDYSGRDAILAAAAPDVDLLIRTSGEQRLSDFLLWELAYAELYFTAQLWPDFGPADLAEALAQFAARNRRFGGLAEVA
jgi:undecaprenyl diphosphate synthase